MKTHKKLLPVLLSASLVLTTLTPALAAETPSEKEEVIYVNLDSTGAVKDMYAVNIFGSGDITDYGDYSAIEILNTTDEISQNGEKITFSTDADRVYYKGTMKSQEIPWNIDIHYYMDDKEYSAKEIAGKSGALKITVNITKNTNCPGDFYEGYALQATVTLDTKQCKNIIAEDATIANVGSSKQLAYTILPNKGADFTITADVTDFEMDGISINCIPLNLSVEVDDDELMDQVTDLLDAIAELDDGASDLKDGASDLSDGGSDLHDGVSDLKDGASELDKGVRSLNQGVKQMQTALNTLNEQSSTLTDGSSEFKKALGQLQTSLSSVALTSQDLTDLKNASADIKKGIGELAAGASTLEQGVSYETYKAALARNGIDIEASLQNDPAALYATKTYFDTVHNNLSDLKTGAATLNTNYAAFDETIGELTTSLGNLTYYMSMLTNAVNTLVTEYEKLDTGITSYTDGVAQIVAGYKQITDGTKQLVSGSSSLKTGTNDLYSGSGELLDGITELSDGTGELKDGTSEMREETDGMDTEISDKIDDMLAEITGEDIEITSFIDERNEDVKSVQFVIQTESIQIEEADDAVLEDTAPLTFWQKLLKLFGWN